MTQPQVAAGWQIERLVAPSPFHTANGIAFGPDGRLYVASVIGEAIFALDLATRMVEEFEPGPEGESDDLVFTSAGEMIWTALLEGAVRMRRLDGSLVDIATGLPGANSIALSRDGRRLFMGQVFMAEGLWEIDLAGLAPPRLVADDTGGLNAFQFGPDGMIYAPSWSRGQVVRVDPESGATDVLIEGLKHPGAVRFDADDRLFVLDDATGELFQLDHAESDWSRRIVATLAPSTDNFIFGPDGRAYVSNMADNTVHAVDVKTGTVEQIVGGALGFPRAVAVSGSGAQLHIADACAYRVFETATREMVDIARAVASPLKFPASVDILGDRVLLVGELFGVVQEFGPTGLIQEIANFDSPSAALALPTGGMVVAEPRTGRILKVEGDQRSVLCSGFDWPVALARFDDDTILVGEAGGTLVRLHLASGTVERLSVVQGLLRSIGVAKDGLVLVLDVLGHRLVRVDLSSARQEVIAHDLPVGRLQSPYPRSGGIAVSGDGAVYVAGDSDNSLWRLRERMA